MVENNKWPGDDCPLDCIYSMVGNSTGDGTRHRHCGYILKGDNGSRGCDVGPGCIRYDNGKKKKPPTKGVGPAWDVAEGRKMWLQGATYLEIAESLGTTRASVDRRVRLYWRKGRD